MTFQKRSESEHWDGNNHHPLDGTLMAYRDDGLPVDQRQSVADHLTTCQTCQEQLQRLESQAVGVSQHLAMLSPTVLEAPNVSRSLATMRHTIQKRKELTMLEKMTTNTRRWLAGAAALIILIALFTLPPVRALASDFLNLFRVQEFALVNIDPERMQRLAEAMEGIEPGQFSGLDDPDEVTHVASLDEAAALAGFTPRTADGYTPGGIVVSGERSATFVPDVEAMRQVFAAVDLDPNLLPDSIDGETFTFSFPAGIGQMYVTDDGSEYFTLMQMPSPSVDGPAGVDVQQLGEAMLRLLGMDEAEARRLSSEIDWTSTMIVPVPTGLASVREVEVDGSTGLLFASEDMGAAEVADTALLWEKDGMVYVLSSQLLNEFDLTDIANNLR